MGEQIDGESEDTFSKEQAHASLVWISAATRAVLASLVLPDEATYAVLSYLVEDAATGEDVRQMRPYTLTPTQVSAILRVKERAVAIMRESGIEHEPGSTIRWQLIAKLADPGPYGR